MIVFSADVVEAVLLGAGEKLVTDLNAIFDVAVYLLSAAFTVRYREGESRPETPVEARLQRGKDLEHRVDKDGEMMEG